MNRPDPENQPADDRVRPGFAAVVFGVPASLIVIGMIFGAPTVYGYVSGISWAGSLFALAVRGFRNEEEDAFAPVESRLSNLAPPLLAIAGVAALLASAQAPGVLLLALAAAWTVAAPWWRQFWQSRWLRANSARIEFALAIATFAYLTWLVWA